MPQKTAYNRVVELLLRERDASTGVWTGRLSSSALSTALAVTALESSGEEDRVFSERGCVWLAANINRDGGWGDTPQSPSNVSTSLIARACLSRHKQSPGVDAALSASAVYINAQTGGLTVGAVADSLKDIYGEDKTFAVPILMYLSICSGDKEDWLKVPRLPFFLALLPGWCFRFFKLEVVSYALPALIAVGLCVHLRRAASAGKRPWGSLIARPLLAKLEHIQPSHGGFLDAVPLTAFVVMALTECGYGDCTVVERGLQFLRRSISGEGSWPIDSNLRCWLTSLTARTLADELRAKPEEAKAVAQWIMDRQYWSVHPYTGAEPGGWAWTDLPGGVPDADDTSAALIALFKLKDSVAVAPLTKCVRLGLSWLMDIQNSDGGVPTFCRGWGHLPFDRSCCDITSHSIEALCLWRDYIRARDFIVFDDGFMARLDKSLCAMTAYLVSQQATDGSWLPLWFGHQQSDGKLNHIIGTARVLAGLRTLRRVDSAGPGMLEEELDAMLQRGEDLLLKEQKQDGGWSAGRDSTIEESALAVISLASSARAEVCASAQRGAEWLEDMILNNEINSSPVGLYFSVLWYDEALYPLIWSASALKAVAPEAPAAGRVCPS